jgi:hypothetical protein
MDSNAIPTPSTKPCIDCARPIPIEARRCIHDNCGAFQDWRRFVGSQLNIVSIATALGVVVSIFLNLQQIRDLASKAEKSDVKAVGTSVVEELTKSRIRMTELQKKLFEVPDEVINRYRKFLEDSSAGVARILPRGKYGDAVLLTGGGSFYSFTRRSNDYGYGSDIEFEGETFKSGFAGADYGFFLYLGDAPIQDVVSEQQFPPSAPDELHEAWTYLWTYRPPLELAKLRDEQDRFGGNEHKVGGVILSDTVKCRERGTYLLRSIRPNDEDSLIAFRLERFESDQSAILVFRVLRRFDKPKSLGPDRQK